MYNTPTINVILLTIHCASLKLALAATSGPNSGQVLCPPQGVTLKMTGAPAGNEVVSAWQKVYSKEYCPGFNITFETNIWDNGAARVCGSSLLQDPVDMASMSGLFFSPQAATDNGWNFQCKRSKEPREVSLVSS